MHRRIGTAPRGGSLAPGMADQYDQATPNHNVGDAEKRAFHAFFRAEVARDVSPAQSGPGSYRRSCVPAQEGAL